jgi:hypothetical protein
MCFASGEKYDSPALMKRSENVIWRAPTTPGSAAGFAAGLAGCSMLAMATEAETESDFGEGAQLVEPTTAIMDRSAYRIEFGEKPAVLQGDIRRVV